MSATAPIATLLCDMGNVLVFFSHERMFRQIADVCGTTPDEVRKILIDSSLQWEFERGRIDEVELHARLQHLFQTTFKLSDLIRATADIFHLNATMVPVLKSLKQQGVRLVLLSNTCVSHVNFIRSQWDVLDLFDHLILSCDVGAIKPEDLIFQEALQEIHCPPYACLYIDDIEPYVVKGRSFGLQGEVFTTTEKFVEKLKELGVQLDDLSSTSPR